jgi:hypothetical protein
MAISRLGNAWALSVWMCGMLVPYGVSYAANDDPKPSDSYVQQGFAIAPVPLDLTGKSPGFVGLGSYIVNTSGCNDCHTWHPPDSTGPPVAIPL